MTELIASIAAASNPYRDQAVALARILFGIIFAAKIYSSWHAHKIMWAHRRPPFFFALLSLLLASTVLFTLGLFTAPAAIVLFVAYVALFRYASFFGMDDTVCHSLALYFLISNPGEAYSLDRLLGIASLGRLAPQTNFPEYFLAAAFGAIFLSAGIKKLQSPLWRRGLGVYYFFLMPLHRRCGVSFFTRHPGLMKCMNYQILFMQAAILPLFLLSSSPAGLLGLIFFTGFAVSLCTIFVFTWLGELILVGFIPLFWILASSGMKGLAIRAYGDAQLLQSPLEQGLVALLALIFFSLLWSGVVSHWIPAIADTAFGGFHSWMRTIARMACGFIPVDLFGEKHIIGPMIYRAFIRNSPQGEKETFRIFTETCLSGPSRNFRPTFIEVTQYKVAEACMEMDAYGSVQTKDREDFIVNLAEYILSQEKPKARWHGEESLLFKTLQLIPPPSPQGADTWYLKEEWVDAFEVRFTGGKGSIRVLKRPILKGPTGRDMRRSSFEFNPKAV